jgi:predicted HicB family RNase H-like nuclease
MQGFSETFVTGPPRRQRRNSGADAKFQLRLPPDLLTEAKAKAATEGRTLSAVIVELLRAYIQK